MSAATNPKGRKKARSLHQSIIADIEGKILSGAWPPGYRIPIEQDLTERYDCSRMTVNKALTQLVNGGLIERRRKSGSFVRQPQSQSAVLEITDISQEVEALGLDYRFDILTSRQRLGRDQDWRQAGMISRGPLLELVCLHHAGPRPFCLEERIINLSVVPDAATEAFAEQAPGTWLINRVPWSDAEHRIEAAAASEFTAAALKIKPQTPLLVIHRTTWGAGQPITQVRLSYPAQGHKLVARFTPTQSG